jgi:DNA repair protein RadC
MASDDMVSLDQIRRKWNFPSLEIKVSYNAIDLCPDKFTNSYVAYKYLLGQWDMDLIDMQEQAMAIYLDASLNIIGHRLISTGGLKSAWIHSKLILAIAINCMASGVIIGHNHPSGDPKPSRADLQATVHMKNCLALLDITLVDHVIITKRHGYYSFRDKEDIKYEVDG